MNLIILFFSVLISCTSVAQEASNHTQVRTKDSTITLKIESKDSYNKSGNLEFIFPGLAVLISLFSIYYSHMLNGKKKKESIHDGFWLREIIYPNCLKSFIIFIEEAPQLYRDNGQDINDFWESYGLNETNKIRDSFTWLLAIDSNLKNKAEIIMDNLEDNIMDVTTIEELNVVLSETVEEIINLLKKNQENT